VAAPVRRCVVTRRCHPAADLVRIVARDGSLHLAGPSDRGRGAWVLPTREALTRLEATPGMAWRTLRVSGVASGPLLDEVRSQTEWMVENARRHCFRSGLMRQSPAEIEADVVAVVVPDVSEPVALSRALVAAAVGRSPASGYHLQSGRPARTLARLLRRLVGLG
jgi:predicted RNA-binding protein YlxR (DUF448 family)